MTEEYRAYRYKDVDAINYVAVEARIVAAIVIGIILSYGIDTRNVLPSSALALMNCIARARARGSPERRERHITRHETMKVYSRWGKKIETEIRRRGKATRDVYTGVPKFSRSSTDQLHLLPVNVRRLPSSHAFPVVSMIVSCINGAPLSDKYQLVYKRRLSGGAVRRIRHGSLFKAVRPAARTSPRSDAARLLTGV